MKKLLSIWQNADGSLSSRRVFGTILIIAGVVGFFLKFDVAPCLGIIGAGSTLLGLTTADVEVLPK